MARGLVGESGSANGGEGKIVGRSPTGRLKVVFQLMSLMSAAVCGQRLARAGGDAELLVNEYPRV